jgi:diaminohydroxyphosphoribosylaminopyrimidine deaminase / 5-amino-6-(5-phosphoribosylamino)uracil reductase
MSDFDFDALYMARALELAGRGLGHVEPNPLVGCTIVRDGEVVGEGWHRRFGGPHAEIEALDVAGSAAAGATMYVTLEPCAHHGKTPPCTQAIKRAGIRRVVAAMVDPFPAVSGRGLAELNAAGLEVSAGLGADEARQLIAPYLKLVETNRPWTIAKWAMTLDGKIATHAGHSRWISGTAAQHIVHRLRGRVDAILVGIGTALADDPLLTARPIGARAATRIILDTHARLPSASQLVRTARDVPVLVAVGEPAPAADIARLTGLGCEVVCCPGKDHAARLDFLLAELGRRRMTNLLVEGGGQVLGSLLDLNQIDEVQVFIAPKLFGGQTAPSPVAGFGRALIEDRAQLEEVRVETVGPDIYLSGRVRRDRSRSG